MAVLPSVAWRADFNYDVSSMQLGTYGEWTGTGTGVCPTRTHLGVVLSTTDADVITSQPSLVLAVETCNSRITIKKLCL